MSQQELLKKVVRAFDRAGIKYMLTGSLVSSLQGEPRSTHDFDFVAALDLDNAGKLIDSLKDPHIFLDPDKAIDAISTKTMFNLIDLNSSDKVDVRLLTKEPFDLSRFDRKYTEEVLGVKVFVTRPEDTILMKLKWAKLFGSQIYVSRRDTGKFLDLRAHMLGAFSAIHSPEADLKCFHFKCFQGSPLPCVYSVSMSRAK